MRQVPYGIVGDGRVARHFCHYFDLLKLPYRQWSRKSLVPVNQELLSCDPILLLIKDDAIETFIQNNPSLKEKTLIHFSGSLVTPLAYGAHPLSTFSHELYSLETYQKIPFFVEENQLDFKQLLPGINNPHFILPKELKSLYHSLCVLSGNFTTILWQKFFKELENKFNIPKQAAFPYLQQIILNVMQDENTALTGPLARGDQITIKNNLSALSGDPFQGIYQAFVEAYAGEQK